MTLLEFVILVPLAVACIGLWINAAWHNGRASAFKQMREDDEHRIRESWNDDYTELQRKIAEAEHDRAS